MLIGYIKIQVDNAVSFVMNKVFNKIRVKKNKVTKFKNL